MPKSIVDIKNMGDALRNTGYKNIESAVSEIIDNSVEADAKNIFLILSESINPTSGRKVVTEIGFLDNGEGMDTDILGGCLGIGATTRQARRGMGRFGVGLPQASLYACPEVVVYSWQNGIENCQKVYLDINKVKQGVQTEIEDPVLEGVPEKYASYINYRTLKDTFDFSKSGTLVIWKNCDRITPKTRGPLSERLEFAIGQKFRYFIHKKLCSIKIICDENQEASIDVAPNDPLFLMEDNRVLSKENEPLKIYRPGACEGLEPVFMPFTVKGQESGEVDIPVKYIDKNGNVAKSTVKVRFSIVKPKFYDETAIPSGNPGASAFGKYARKLEGISVIRANREIDFRQFDFYSTVNEPTHRWWGCEIIFDPILDESFGVSNNKQYVELKKIEEADIDWDEEVQPMWIQLTEVISNTIKEMYATNEKTRKNTRTIEGTNTPATNIINTVENEGDDDVDDIEIEDPMSGISTEEIIEKGKEELTNLGVEMPTDEEATKFFDNSVVFDYADKGERSPAFDYKFVLSTTIITINTTHEFYCSFLRKIYDNLDAKTTFELFLASLVQSIKKTNTYQKVQNDKLVTMWFNKLNNYISEQLNPRNG